MTEVRIPAADVTLPGTLTLPETASAVVLFAHGSASGRQSPRNRQVAEVLHQAGIGTLLFDLLTEDESVDRKHVFDVHLLAQRLEHASRWIEVSASTRSLPRGYFGASTGAAAALIVGAAQPHSVSAIVSRGGRPDLAGDALGSVRAPTLLLVGAHDFPVLKINQAAAAQLRCTKRLTVIPGATHLFEEPGAMEEVARLATDWFSAHLRRGGGVEAGFS